jgi:hypothetical protein
MGAPSIGSIPIRSAPLRCEKTTVDPLFQVVNNNFNSPVRCKCFPNCAWRAKKRVFRVKKEHNLLVEPNLKLTAKPTPSRSQTRPTKPHEWWGIDMTKVLWKASGGSLSCWCWIGTRKRSSGNTLVCPKRLGIGWQPWTWRQTASFLKGARDQCLSLMSDNGCQPISLAFLKACSTMGIQQPSPAITIPRATLTPSGSCACAKKHASGSRSGAVPLPISQRFSLALNTEWGSRSTGERDEGDDHETLLDGFTDTGRPGL